jgi:hypothetical protein
MRMPPGCGWGDGGGGAGGVFTLQRCVTQSGCNNLFIIIFKNAMQSNILFLVFNLETKLFCLCLRTLVINYNERKSLTKPFS